MERSGAKEGQEFYHYELEPTAPVLALLGDIGCVVHDMFFAWLEAQLAHYEDVLFVPGNHEPYRTWLDDSDRRLEEFASRHAQADPPSGRGRFVLLNRGRFDLSPTLTILGCTLWTRLADDELDILSWSLSDLKRIDGFTPAAYMAAHLRDLAWLNSAVQEAIDEAKPDRQIVVFTHHPPLRRGTSDPRFGKDDLTKSAFSTDLTSEPCWKAKEVCFWAFGHTHFSCDFEADGKRIYANQRGYRDGEGLYDSRRVVDFA